MILPLLLVAGKVAASIAAAAAVAAAIVCLDKVLHNLRRHKLKEGDIGELVRTQLENGNFKVVGSVMSKRRLGFLPRRLRHVEAFEGKLDAKLQALFGGKNRVRIKL